ncbi:hypothetical protein [Natronorubrum sulfidifaciens]|uniref:hypothetical protein n=1 Tax=Natronorubrum sulfidifaciens TaxID=388259 RepID=UPI0012674D47|nr:hypothetical protein [Natronorubrum sulfidifaciens]
MSIGGGYPSHPQKPICCHSSCTSRDRTTATQALRSVLETLASALEGTWFPPLENHSNPFLNALD